MTSTTTSCTSSGNALRPSLCEQVGGEQRCFIPLLLSDTRDQCVRRGIGQLVEPALQGGSTGAPSNPAVVSTVSESRA